MLELALALALAAAGAGVAAAAAVTGTAGAAAGAAREGSAPRAAPGDPARGAAIVASRAQGLCVLCHAVPGVPAVHSGTIGPALDGVGARLEPGALRERLVAPERFNPQTVMPSFARTEGLARVTPARRGRPILEPQQIEDVVAYLSTLR